MAAILHTVAFPAISTGASRYPRKDTSKISVETVQGALGQSALHHRVLFCCFSAGGARTYREILGR
ncbi:MAG: hypothetical protein KUG77_08150 [Nannocystaceae bacterium]|nr:hypothetical protein [Nannocystaceae bacterium]